MRRRTLFRNGQNLGAKKQHKIDPSSPWLTRTEWIFVVDGANVLSSQLHSRSAFQGPKSQANAKKTEAIKLSARQAWVLPTTPPPISSPACLSSTRGQWSLATLCQSASARLPECPSARVPETARLASRAASHQATSELGRSYAIRSYVHNFAALWAPMMPIVWVHDSTHQVPPEVAGSLSLHPLGTPPTTPPFHHSLRPVSV